MNNKVGFVVFKETIVCTELSDDPQQYSQKLVLCVCPRTNKGHIHPSVTTLVISADLEDQMSGGDTSGEDLQAQPTTSLSAHFSHGDWSTVCKLK